MTRRQAVRLATLLGAGAILGNFNIAHASNGQLTVDLDQWGFIVFKRKGKTCAVSVDEVFQALVEAPVVLAKPAVKK